MIVHIICSGWYFALTSLIYVATLLGLYNSGTVKLILLNYVCLQCAKRTIWSLVLGEKLGLPISVVPVTRFEFVYGWLALTSLCLVPWCLRYPEKTAAWGFVTISHLVHFLDYVLHHQRMIVAPGRRRLF